MHQKCLIRIQITALKFLTSNVIVAGIGPRLCFFDLKIPDQIMCSIDVFDTTRIHGIVMRKVESDESQVILGIHGGKQLCLLRITINQDEIIVDQISERGFDDWIKDLWISSDLEVFSLTP
jgi:hypothetical protein